MNELQVIKRNGELQDISFDKILTRVKILGKDGNYTKINYSLLCLKVIDQLYNKIPTSKIDELTAEQCASMCVIHTDYGSLGSRVSISNLQKNTLSSFYDSMKILWQNKMLGKKTWLVIDSNKDILENSIAHENDFLLDYFGYKTLERSYLIRNQGKIIERPQYMWMRVAIGIHENDIESVLETYRYMSELVFTHATPTLFNAGTPRPQLSSCFLHQMKSDSIEGIYDTLKDCALISKTAGGIGLDISKIRASGTHIKGTNGISNGIVPMLRVFNATAKYVDQGGGKRPGSFAIYLEPHHADIEDFLELRKNHGDEELKARDLFLGLWISDCFMKAVDGDTDWYLMCPNKCPKLLNTCGDNYTKIYYMYVKNNNYIRKIKARELWFKILDSQMETGTPYILYKDACNNKSNQQNLGIINCSNLCTEIIEYSSPEETAVCNLASIALSKFVNSNKLFDYDKLHMVAKILVRNLNKVIDINYYPVPSTKLSNLLHRPVGIGVQGLADAFFKMDIAFESEEAIKTNKFIFETIYHAAVECSNELAIERKEAMKQIRIGIDNDYIAFTSSNKINQNIKYSGATFNKSLYYSLIDRCTPNYSEINNLKEKHLGSYSSFSTSPTSEGILQFDMWNVIPTTRYDWNSLKQSVIDNGLRNSLLVAPMPTASTAQILGNNEAFEPTTSNIYTRGTNAGQFMVINKYLVKELSDLNLWNEEIKNSIIKNRGSVQHLDILTEHQKNKYKIVWEMPMKHIINMAADRGAFIDQSQSLNLWIESPNYNILTSMHFYGWKKGLKTGMYYLRRKPESHTQQFTIEPDNECEMCSS